MKRLPPISAIYLIAFVCHPCEVSAKDDPAWRDDLKIIQASVGLTAKHLFFDTEVAAPAVVRVKPGVNSGGLLIRGAYLNATTGKIEMADDPRPSIVRYKGKVILQSDLAEAGLPDSWDYQWAEDYKAWGRSVGAKTVDPIFQEGGVAFVGIAANKEGRHLFQWVVSLWPIWADQAKEARDTLADALAKQAATDPEIKFSDSSLELWMRGENDVLFIVASNAWLDKQDRRVLELTKYLGTLQGRRLSIGTYLVLCHSKKAMASNPIDAVLQRIGLFSKEQELADCALGVIAVSAASQRPLTNYDLRRLRDAIVSQMKKLELSPTDGGVLASVKQWYSPPKEEEGELDQQEQTQD